MSAFNEQRVGHRCDARGCEREAVTFSGSILGGQPWVGSVSFDGHRYKAGWRLLYDRVWCPDHSPAVEAAADAIGALQAAIEELLP